jgi:hypothetical protein
VFAVALELIALELSRAWPSRKAELDQILSQRTGFSERAVRAHRATILRFALPFLPRL